MKKYLLFVITLSVTTICKADFNEGVEAYNRGDYTTALKKWEAVAEQSSINNNFEWHPKLSQHVPDSQYAVALLYWQGKGVNQDYKKAEKWLTLAATAGHSEAQLKLAYLLMMGLTGTENYIDAKQWLEKSANQGNVDAQYNLAMLYFKGLGVKQDHEEAKKWLAGPVKQGDKSAINLLAQINSAHQLPSPPMSAIAPKPLELPANPSDAQKTDLTVPVKQGDKPAINSLAETNSTHQLPPPPMPAIAPKPLEPPANTSDATIPAGGYAIQLYVSDKQGDVIRVMEKWQATLKPMTVFDKMKNGKRLFVLAYGSYPTTTQATNAITTLPAELKKNKPWVIKKAW
jgi:hypothetical protein